MTVKKKAENVDYSEEAMRYINEGAQVKSDFESKMRMITTTIRMPATFMEKMDVCVEKRIGMSRNAWIMQAIQEKIKRETDSN